MTEKGNGKPYAFDTSMSEQREEYVERKLIEYNRAHGPRRTKDPRYIASPLHIYILDDRGSVIGGLIGRTHELRDWLEVSSIWVDEAIRGQGYGRRLMEKAEEEAWKRGCRYARLATSDYQAPGFYQKLGYMMYGQLEDCPPGETAYYFRKDLQ